jgi:hypothetical protein
MRACDQPPWSWLLLEEVGDLLQPSCTETVEAALLARNHGYDRALSAADQRHERRQVELAADLELVRHRFAQRERLPDVVEARAEHREPMRAVPFELVVEEGSDPPEVRLQSQADLVCVVRAVVLLLPLVEERVDSRLGVSGRRSDPGIEIDVEADGTAFLGSKTSELPECIPRHTAGH